MAVNNLGATEEEQNKIPHRGVEKPAVFPAQSSTERHSHGGDRRDPGLALSLARSATCSCRNWSAHAHFREKKRAVEISHEIQQNISHYLFSVTLINIGLRLGVSAGLYCMGVRNAAMWGMLVAAPEFCPVLGPSAGILLLATVGFLMFDTFWQAVLPAAWYLLLYLLEANFITPVLLGRRFTLNPVIIFVSLIFWIWIWGVPGALLSVPILVSIKAVSDRVPRCPPSANCSPDDPAQMT